ncbi:ASKHA domain-containing protein [Euzebya tangerina]|uniref:ASKHA domain-containing protein n=1 Tax=Euzebya tangerina TaxID=591198 RepID=UPI0014743F14|nr:ASKHA domain-containing protein [Euzebya tangerina]
MPPPEPGGDSTVAITFSPSGRRGRVAPGTTVLDAARALGVDLDSVCGGRGLCGRCQIGLGEQPGVGADPSHLGAVTSTERAYRGRRPLLEGRRLGCAAIVEGDVVIAVPPESQAHRQVVRKAAGDRPVDVDPVVVLRYVEIPPATMEDRRGDLQRLRDALAHSWGVAEATVDLAALAELGPAIAQHGGGVTVALRREDGAARIVAVWPGLKDAVYGAAFDIGSTTVAGHLCHLGSGEVLASAGRMNPQIAYGEDLMSRVSYVMMNADGRERLTAAVRGALADLVQDLSRDAGIDPDDILEVCLVGNPIMHHLVLGLDPTPLGSAPFALATTEAITVPAAELRLGTHAGARVYLPPLIAGHVGADATAMVLADAPDQRDELTLLVDVGTNAELVLGNADRLLAASSPTGPAFEGAQISSGQRAARGAIERVRIDPITLEPRLRVIGSELWSDDPGFAASIQTTGITGICGSGIIEVLAELFLAGVITADGRLQPRDGDAGHPRLVRDERTWRYRLVEGDPGRGQMAVDITQNDVRAIQLAKAALYAGARLLMDRLGVDAVDRVHLAGAFGNHIDPLRALVLGLVPDCEPAHVTSVGNAAGHGSLMSLLSVAARRRGEQLASSIEKVETAIEPRFQEHFVAAMGFPHTTATYRHLAEHVALPAPTTGPPAARTSGRRTRSRR